ncbi:uncharacterized protein LOC127279132 isoform X2 [Leptopilina boulardi]|uniref:uncharacterized protein LOC127279132 isoform X2 n=1 Tax=Leptopilina boulardi TaxID=63433 RepID=UPI0021F61C52|nr:uncharacterized protein LOC127279132 isoform X2 [Leptopilina boulardi]
MEPKEDNNYHLKFGQAPMASFEDFNDEADNVGIGRVTITTTKSSLQTSSTPRIDISRASSSSHHEDSCNSRESSPERELLAGGEPPDGCKIRLNYKEDDQDLRSSTEELDLPDPIHEQDFKREAKRSTKRLKDDKLHSEYYISMKAQERERKDSNCSEIILLNISGRTSRLSSVGSQGSGHSGKMSVASNVSSRSPSPHKCLLETSFCGHSPTQFNNIEPTKIESEDIEKILLEREADTTKALIPSDIKVQTMGGKFKPDPLDKPRRRGREERKEFFRREVEITKKVLEEANIEVRVIRKELQEDTQKENSENELLKTTGDSYSSMHNLHTMRRGTSGSIRDSDVDSKDTKKNSFVSLFKGKHGSEFTEPQSPCICSKTRRNSLVKRKGSFDNLKKFHKCREKLSTDQGRPVTIETRSRSLFSSTLSIFRKKERKKNFEATSKNEENNEKVTYSTLNCLKDKELSSKLDENSTDNQIKIQYCSTKFNESEKVLPSESISMPIESPTQLLEEYDLQHRLDKNYNTTENSNISIKVDTHCRMKYSPKYVGQEASNNLEISAPTSNEIECKEHTNPDCDDHNFVLNFGSAKRGNLRVKRRCKENQERIDISSEDSIESVYASCQKIQRRKHLIHEQDQMSLQFLNQMQKERNELELEHNSSESEKDSEIEFIKQKSARCIEGASDEGRSLFYDESFEEDYCVLPATIVKENDKCFNMLPTRGRQLELRTVPIERPRSATPINPTLLDNFVMHTSLDEPCTEKMKIFLPKAEHCKTKSHRKMSANTFIEFAGKVQDNVQKNINKNSRSPSIPLKLLNAQPSNWINFDEIPEKRRIPKRIQTIPQAEEEDKIKTFNYVQPEECRCNCHDMPAEVSMEKNGEMSLLGQSCTNSGGRSCSGENCIISRNWSDRTTIFRNHKSVQGKSNDKINLS